MKKMKKSFSIFVAIIFTSLAMIQPGTAYGIVSASAAKQVVATATKDITNLEKLVKNTAFNVTTAQKQVDLATKSLSKVNALGAAYTAIFKNLNNRLKAANTIVKKKAEAEKAKVSVMKIANSTYDSNMKKLDPVKQQLLNNAFQELENKSRFQEDSAGYISMAYMTIVTGKTDPKEQAIVAAWGVKKQPDSICILNNFGYALSILKDNANAITVYQCTLAIESNSLETMFNLGNLYMDMNQDEDAKKQYENALKIDDTYEKAWEGLYGYYMKKKDFKKAMEILAKINPPGTIQATGYQVQQELDQQEDKKQLDMIDEEDTLESAENKMQKIAKSIPLTVAPIINEINPEMAKQIETELSRLKTQVKAPSQPFLYDYTDAKQYYITSNGYDEVKPFPEENLDDDPKLKKIGEQFEGLSKADIDKMVEDYLKDAKGVMDKMQNTDFNDLAALAQMAKEGQKLGNVDPLTKLPTGKDANDPNAITSQNLGLVEKKGIVSTSNYNNYNFHVINFSKYIEKVVTEFEKGKSEIADAYSEDMNQLMEKQAQISKDGKEHPEFIRQRNAVRDVHVAKFGDYLQSFYNGHVKKAIEQVENTQSLYIKNMANNNLKKKQGEQMKVILNGFLGYFSKASAPIGSYEPENDKAAAQLEEQIQKVKDNAPKAGETIPELKQFESSQKSLLEEIYGNLKFEGNAGLCKLSYSEGEITLGLNDPIHNEYMDFGVNLIDQSVSLTEGKGSEVSFKVAKGSKGSKLASLEAGVGYSDRQPGKKTTIYFDDNLNAVDAKITKTSGSQGFSAEVEAADISIEGGMKIETTAEGTSEFVSSIKASFHNWQLLERLYKEKLGGK